MARLKPKQTSHRRQHTAYLPDALQNGAFVFVRHDAHRTPLQCTYGPFRVLERNFKYFTPDLHGKWDTVSVDRRKPVLCGYQLRAVQPHNSTNSQQSQPALHSPLSLPSPSKTPPAVQAQPHTPAPTMQQSRSGHVIRLPVKLHESCLKLLGGAL